MPVRLIERLFGMEPGDLRPALGLMTVYAAVGGAVAAGDATVQAVFLSRAGADRLPEVLLARALALPLLAALYARLARHRSPRAVMVTLAALATLAAIGGWILMERDGGGSLVAYVLHEVVTSLVTVHWGVYLLDHLSGPRALRAVPVVHAAARLGAAVAGAMLAPLVALTDAPSGMLLTASLFFLVAPLTVLRRPTGERVSPPERRASLAPADSDATEASIPPPPPEGYRRLLSSPLLPALVVSTGVMVFVRYALRYQQQTVLETISEAELVGLLAWYAAAGNLIGVVLQVVIMGRVLSRVGLTLTNMAYAVMAAIAQGLLLLTPGLGSALFARFADSELKHAIKTPLSSLFYEAFEPQDRAPARAVVLGFASPAAQVLASVGLFALVDLGTPTTAATVGIVACALFVVSTVAQNRGYERAIRRDSLPGRE